MTRPSNIWGPKTNRKFIHEVKIPPRLAQQEFPNATYDEIPETDRKRLLRTTCNPHEFLSLYRLEHGVNPQDIGVTSAELRTAELDTFPNKELLAKLKSDITKRAGEEIATKFEDMVISNRLAFINSRHNEKLTVSVRDHTIKPRDFLGRYNSSIAAHIREMPPRYWQAVLDQFHNPEEYERSYVNTNWANQIVKIEVKEDYLRAMRGTCSKTDLEITSSLGCSKRNITDIESSYTDVTSEFGIKLAAFYENQITLDNETNGTSRIFDRAKYEQTIFGYSRPLTADEKEKYRVESNAKYINRAINEPLNSASR